MKPKLFFVLAVLTLATALIAAAQTAKPEPGADEASAKLDALLRQRQKTLQQLVTITRAGYQAGVTTFDAVIRASSQLQNAELELAKDRHARIAIHKQRIDLLKDFAKILEARYRAGNAAQEDVLATRAACLEAEIRLLREQLGK